MDPREGSIRLDELLANAGWTILGSGGLIMSQKVFAAGAVAAVLAAGAAGFGIGRMGGSMDGETAIERFGLVSPKDHEALRARLKEAETALARAQSDARKAAAGKKSLGAKVAALEEKAKAGTGTEAGKAEDRRRAGGGGGAPFRRLAAGGGARPGTLIPGRLRGRPDGIDRAHHRAGAAEAHPGAPPAARPERRLADRAPHRGNVVRAAAQEDRWMRISGGDRGKPIGVGESASDRSPANSPVNSPENSTAKRCLGITRSRRKSGRERLRSQRSAAKR